MIVEVESHEFGAEEHRKECSFCRLAFGVSKLCEGHPVEEVWEVLSTVLLRAMSENAAEDGDFLKAASHFQMLYAENVIACLVERVAARVTAAEKAGMH